MLIFKLVINILRRGLNAAAYAKREVILIDIVSQLFPNNINYKCANNYEVECSMNEKIFSNESLKTFPVIIRAHVFLLFLYVQWYKSDENINFISNYLYRMYYYFQVHSL